MEKKGWEVERAKRERIYIIGFDRQKHCGRE